MESFSDAEQALMQCDEILGRIIAANGSITRKPRDDYFASLARSIISQQISVKAAAKIFERFCDTTNLQPEQVAMLSEADCKTIGLSGQKFRYLRDLAQHFVDNSAIFDHLDSLDDDDVIAELTRVKGIGVWTAQMFLMSTLVRPDIFASDDLGLQNAVMRLYNLSDRPTRTELEALAITWKPYRTTASWHLWASLDNAPV